MHTATFTSKDPLYIRGSFITSDISLITSEALYHIRSPLYITVPSSDPKPPITSKAPITLELPHHVSGPPIT